MSELIERGLHYIYDSRAFRNLKDQDRIVAVNGFGEQAVGTYDETSCSIGGLRGKVTYWRHAVPADERLATTGYN
ncbi:MAG TPA: hypothetical protein VF720_05120 [Candidatus Eisenbacteria bacterium]